MNPCDAGSGVPEKSNGLRRREGGFWRRTTGDATQKGDVPEDGDRQYTTMYRSDTAHDSPEGMEAAKGCWVRCAVLMSRYKVR